jgi:hypothetical protein
VRIEAPERAAFGNGGRPCYKTAMPSEPRSEARPASRGQRALFTLSLLPILIALLVHSTHGPLPEAMVPMQAILGGAALAWIGAIVLAARGAGDLRLVIVGAVALRLLAFAGEPTLSDDVYRYAWEGNLLASGVSPYAYAPDAPELEEFRVLHPEVYERMNNPSVSAAYPPVTQYAAVAVTFLARLFTFGDDDPVLAAVTGLRCLFGFADLLVLLPLMVLLSRRRAATLAVAWGWSPLIALEFAGSGHFDSLGILLLVGALALLPTKRGERIGTEEWGALVLLTGAILVKFLPLAALPFFVRGPRAWKRLAWVVLFVVLAYAPFFLLPERGGGLLAGIGAYGLQWEGGSLVFRLIDRVVRDVPGLTWLDIRLQGRAIVLILWLACALWAWTRRLDPVRATGLLIAAFLVLSPTLHPWYLAWAVPFFALRPSLAWGWLIAAAPLAYWPLEGWRARGVWEEPAWLWAAYAGPFFALLILDRVLAARRAERERLELEP